ncbi:MAG: hypothetical protein SFT94_05070 [Pseudanabaenaceae cyanobacterium bins.68]|nr:hypothetical protein [Pseudanabaenaceae cyanobacterium bins.68]
MILSKNCQQYISGLTQSSLGDVVERDFAPPAPLRARFLDQVDENKPLTREDRKKIKRQGLEKVKNSLGKYFSDGGNPTDWYVLAVGDGMGEWLKGKGVAHLKDDRGWEPLYGF